MENGDDSVQSRQRLLKFHYTSILLPWGAERYQELKASVVIRPLCAPMLVVPFTLPGQI